jgi:hypothetical protein
LNDVSGESYLNALTSESGEKSVNDEMNEIQFETDMAPAMHLLKAEPADSACSMV